MSSSDLRKPMFSAHSDDPSKSEAIDHFVLGLAERIDHAQDAERANDPARLVQICESWLGEARRLGYEDFTRGSERVIRAAHSGDSRAIHAALVDLTDLAHRIRLGHRGAL